MSLADKPGDNERRPAHAAGVARGLRLDRAIALVWHVSPGLMVTGALLAALEGVLPVASLYLIKLIVDAVTAAVGSAAGTATGAVADGGATAWLTFLPLGWLISLACAVAAIAVLARLLSALVNESQSLRVADHVSDLLHAKSVEVDLEYYENPSYFDLLHRAQSEAPYRPKRVVDGLLNLVRSGVALVGILGLLVTFNWWLALMILGAALPGIAVKTRYSGRLFGEQLTWTPDERRAAYLNHLLTGRPAAKELRLLNLGGAFRARYSDLRRRLRSRRLSLTRRRSLAEAGTEMVALAAVFAALGWVAFRTVAGAVTLGSMVMHFGAVHNASSSLRSFLSGLAGLHEDNLFLSHFHDFLALRRTVAEPEHPRAFPVPLTTGVRFEGVAFSYPGSERHALQGVSLDLRVGQVTALVGRNGSGKTTLVKLLARLYDPDSGRVLVDGMDIRNLGLVDLRRSLSVIFQDSMQYNFTARDNIWLGDTGADPQGPRVTKAAQAAGAHKLLVRLACGYDTVLGKWFEEGEELSVGEWQRVALARAFLPQAQVLVLDEPTSSLDAEAEASIFERIRNLAAARAVLVISHRYSTVRMADRIVVLEQGRVVEEGSHEELTTAGGRYAQMFRAQTQPGFCT